MRPKLIAPSILSADFAHLAEEVQAVEKAGADWIHVDVMDGHFVPNITIGAPVVKSLRPVTQLPLDVHLMIENPEKYVEDFARAGADYMTVHIESTENPVELIQKIRDLGCRPGVTLRPGTSLGRVLPLIEKVDLVLVMTVEPGFGGQKFMVDQMDKVKVLRQEIETKNLKTLIEVDGGVSAETLKHLDEVDVLVAGSYVFKNNYAEAIGLLKGER